MSITPPPTWEHTLPRRSFLRAVGGAAGAAALAGVLTACGNGSEETRPVVRMANRPGAIDRRRTADGRTVVASLQGFTRETGIEADYREVVVDPERFVEALEPYLAAGQPTGWDIVVLRTGPVLTELLRRGVLQELPADRRPNWDDNAAAAVREPAFDPGGRRTMAWRSGITGIAYDPDRTDGPITSLGDLFSRRFAGRVGMFRDMVDLPNLAMVSLGVDPATSTPADWDAAAARLRRQRDDGVVGQYVPPGSLAALARGRVALTMAWSDEVVRANEGRRTPLGFAVPTEGGLLWTDAMAIPIRASNPAGAIRLMDHVYRPDVAAQITASVAGIPPVRGARERLLGMAAQEGDLERASSIRGVATSPLVFPEDDDLSRLSTYRELESDEELARWDAVFRPFAG